MNNPGPRERLCPVDSVRVAWAEGALPSRIEDGDLSSHRIAGSGAGSPAERSYEYRTANPAATPGTGPGHRRRHGHHDPEMEAAGGGLPRRTVRRPPDRPEK